MATLVCFHAHPDDEAISTGGLMAKAADAGHRVILVCATNGEHGEPREGVLAEDEALWERRIVELARSARILGAEEPILLGYEDSGMMGEPTNANPGSFWQADHDEAVGKLATILREVDADVLTIYDDHGGYGHPDHLRVHTVGKAAAALAAVEHVYEATINRDAVREFIEAAADDPDNDFDVDSDSTPDTETFGTAAVDISWEIDVSDAVERKKAAIMAHRSQIGPESFFLTMSEEDFRVAFGREWFNVPDLTGTGGPRNIELLPGLS